MLPDTEAAESTFPPCFLRLLRSSGICITVAPVNDAPVAAADAYITNEDTTLSITAPGVLANDGDVDGDALTAVVDAAPVNGSLVLNGDGSFNYTPDAEFSGTDSFSYHASDGTTVSDVATVNITVGAINDPPAAVDDAYVTDEDTVLTEVAPGVLANDSDAENDSLTALLSAGTLNGSVTFNGDGSFSYTPNADFNGSDEFTYQASDGLSGSNLATVTITVNAVDDAPVAAADAYATNEDTTLNVAAQGLLANDGDVDGDPLTAVLDALPESGSLALNLDGSFIYTPDADFNGTDSFTYHANDGTSNSNVATVTITVDAVNDAPAAVDDTYSTGEDTELTVAAPGVLGNDSDVDGDPLAAVLDTLPVSGTLTLNADGSFTYTPAADFNGTDSFSYHADDGTSDSNVATVTITVSAVGDAPVANDDAYTTAAGTVLTVAAPGVLTNDNDVDGEPLTAVLDTAPGNGTLTLNADGSFTYTPDAAFTGTDTFSYQANDGTLDSNVATVTITVQATSLAVTGITPDSAPAGSTVAVTISGSGFQDGATLALENGQGPAPDILNLVVVDASTLTATFSIKQGGPPRDRPWDVRVTNPDGQTDVLVAGFTVTLGTAATTPESTTSGNFLVGAMFRDAAVVNLPEEASWT